jgi:pyruvate kinase
VEGLGASAVNAAAELGAKAIVVMSQSGRTAAAVAKYRPSVPVLCLVTDERVAHSLQLNRGVHAVLVSANELGGGRLHDVPARRALALEMIKDWGIGETGDRVVMCHGIGANMTGGMSVSVAKLHARK